MISRRNIRVKVMQTLYTIDSMSGEVKPGEPLTILNKKLDATRNLFTYLVYFITEVARYAETVAKQRASKNLPTAEDLSVNTKIAGNELLWKIVEQPGFISAVAEYKLKHILDAELLRKIYLQLADAAEYKEYIETPSRNKNGEREILEYIFSTLMLPSEEFTSHIEEFFINWDDDAEMMQQLVIQYLQKPSGYDFGPILSKEKQEFAKSLLQTTLDKTEVSLELIKPKLKNWDADRIAALDMIILQMGVCEFLYFETIPTKVTINEYIDLAKEYSTVQSGQFVNGLLDNIHKELTAQNKIHKKSHKNNA
ncbi:MAG: transcription antitermination factor NusB [Bacteroidetes bacterium]|nr:transcription antitermination factor NusB [Bacteroidota bacterium]